MASADWQINKPQLECFEYMFENQISCDVNFKIGEDLEDVKAHKLILSMRSPVFEKMFNGCFEESGKDPEVPDVPVAAFQALLRYCYYECVDFDDGEALPILCAAKKYMLPLLEEEARGELIWHLDEDNVWEVYSYAISVGDTKIQEGCQVYFEGNLSHVTEALQNESFLDIPYEVLLDVLQINCKVDKVHDPKEKFIICQNVGISTSEIELFKACNAWAEAECQRQEIDPNGVNKRTVLGECLFLLRFPTMLYKDLVHIVYPTGILNQTEKDNLCQYKHTGTEYECPVDFPSKLREFVVALPGPVIAYDIIPVYIKSEVRVMLSRVWITWSGSFRVTVKDEASDRSWSRRYDTIYERHITDKDGSQAGSKLYFLDMESEMLKADTRYSIVLERLEKRDHARKTCTKSYIMQEACPYEEVKITMSPPIYALTLALV